MTAAKIFILASTFSRSQFKGWRRNCFIATRSRFRHAESTFSSGGIDATTAAQLAVSATAIILRPSRSSPLQVLDFSRMAKKSPAAPPSNAPTGPVNTANRHHRCDGSCATTN